MKEITVTFCLSNEQVKRLEHLTYFYNRLMGSSDDPESVFRYFMLFSSVVDERLDFIEKCWLGIHPGKEGGDAS